jgi:hypothetical protein
MGDERLHICACQRLKDGLLQFSFLVPSPPLFFCASVLRRVRGLAFRIVGWALALRAGDGLVGRGHARRRGAGVGRGGGGGARFFLLRSVGSMALHCVGLRSTGVLLSFRLHGKHLVPSAPDGATLWLVGSRFLSRAAVER